MYDFFAAKETYLPTENAYASATGKQDPFPSGYRDRPQGKRITLRGTATSADLTITATFDPSEATDACSAWSTLRSYCGDSGEDCACYSGTYYVPDQWNSLADGCASVTSRCSGTDTDDATWCQFGKTAYDYNTYCPDEPSRGSAISAKFAERANIASDAMATADSDPEPTTDESVASQTGSSSSSPNVAQTTPETSRILSSQSIPTTTSQPVGSWSTRSVTPVVASIFAWISLLTAMIIL